MLEYYSKPVLQMIDWRKVFCSDSETLISTHLRSHIPPMNIRVRWRVDETEIGVFIRGMSELIYTWKPAVVGFAGSVDFTDPHGTKFTPEQLRSKLMTKNLHNKAGYLFEVAEGNWRSDQVDYPSRLGARTDQERLHGDELI